MVGGCLARRINDRATVVVGGVVVVVVVVDVELSMIGSGVPPSSPSAKIVPVVTAVGESVASLFSP